MKTIILKIDPEHVDEEKIKQAAEVIRNGGLVAFPTETVYGLGANALDGHAVRKIFEAKGRPADNPLIVHIASVEEAYKLAKNVPEKAKKLMEKFWPGPLTLIMEKRAGVPVETTAGLKTVAIRMPDHPVALALIKHACVPIAAPSANLSGKPSPTNAEHVIRDLKGRVDVIIDSGSVRIGLESTVIDMTSEPPVLLRPGYVNREMLESVIGKVEIHPAAFGKFTGGEARSPGMKYRHYAPEARVIVVEGARARVREKIRELVSEFKKSGRKVGLLVMDKRGYKADMIISVGRDKAEVASKLFWAFREFDDAGVDVIIAEGVEESGIGLAIMNRMRKAAYKIVEA